MLDDFYTLEKTEQAKLLAYCQIRELEEAHQLNATMQIGLARHV